MWIVQTALCSTYEGEKGAERLVRVVRSDGMVHHYEGEKGTERLVRVVRPDGCVQLFCRDHLQLVPLGFLRPL